LHWSAIDLPAKTITYRARKTGKLVTIPIHQELENYLLELTAPDSGNAFVFPKLAGRCTGGRSGLSMTFSRIMARAGVVGEVLHKAKKGGQGRTVRALTFHSLRHSFNSAMANAGVSQEIRQKLTMSAQMNAIYTHHELEPLRAAIAQFQQLACAMATCQLKRGDDRSVRETSSVPPRLNQRSGGVEGSIVVRADLYLSKFQNTLTATPVVAQPASRDSHVQGPVRRIAVSANPAQP
jgi:hypothetical protein